MTLPAINCPLFLRPFDFHHPTYFWTARGVKCCCKRPGPRRRLSAPLPFFVQYEALTRSLSRLGHCRRPASRLPDGTYPSVRGLPVRGGVGQVRGRRARPGLAGTRHGGKVGQQVKEEGAWIIHPVLVVSRLPGRCMHLEHCCCVGVHKPLAVLLLISSQRSPAPTADQAAVRQRAASQPGKRATGG